MENSEIGGDDASERRLAECWVDYMLFLTETRDAQPTTLDAVKKAALRLAGDLTAEYIWQRDPFNLEIRSQGGLTYLYGRTDYGDAVEDEWLVVYLLREISRTFPGLWIRVFDCDGEFLFIEAASVLPKWLRPDMDAHRAWIHQGKLQIVPLEPAAEPTKSAITLEEAVNAIKADGSSLVHSPLVEAEAFYRLEKYPGQIAHALHHSLVTIPRRLAYLLHAQPKAIAPAVEAFYLRSPSSMRPLLDPSLLHTMKFPPADFVTVSVRFTKVLFAQVKSQHFQPPTAWATALAQAADPQGPGEQRRLSRLEIGMKITCGFEMLAAAAEENQSRVVREVGLLLHDLEEDGNQAVPTDQDIRLWEGVDRDDDEGWLDINFEDLELELQGGAGRARHGARGTGFGDASAAADLRKIVSRFEAFLNDESAGIDGAEVDPRDDSEDGYSSEDEASDGEDRDVSFDEEEFARMMREMMGLPPSATRGRVNQAPKEDGEGRVPPRDEEGDAIREIAAQMETELKGHAALSLAEASPRLLPEQSSSTGVGGAAREDGGDDEIDVDYNLAKNLLESFKGQAGMAGPVGNILGLMGMALPRDEGGAGGDNAETTRQGKGKQQ